ncbi:MAG TPA: PHP-associated domain-containing protein [Acidimicrobiales bacterium]|nr:PHP-associated domain-containing protein [Acidimicrobiales bacterium]
MAASDDHPHLSRPRPPGTVRVDMHSHTMWSGDCTTTPDEIAVAVEAAGLDVLCVTDHNAIRGAQALVGDLPCRVVVGEEVRTGSGEMIGLFLDERIPPGLGAEETAVRIRDQGGLVYIPHPYDPARHCMSEPVLHRLLADGLVDAIEVFNSKTSLPSLNRRAAETAAAAGLASGAGSDAHVPAALGAAYVEVADFAGPGEFLASLTNGAVFGHYFDPPRPWRSRIVPSTSPY